MTDTAIEALVRRISLLFAIAGAADMDFDSSDRAAPEGAGGESWGKEQLAVFVLPSTAVRTDEVWA